MTNLNVKVLDGAVEVVKVLKKNGYNAYLVGGCVRDAIMGIEPHDWDICTNAKPDEMVEVFKKYKVIGTGLKHGTITVMVRGEGYEVTTFRVDEDYCDHRRPDKVIFVDDINEDLSRRDFTMNAMAYDIDGESLIDTFGGIGDIQRGVIRCVGNAEDRFEEDALRILRALRFSARYGFKIEENTSRAIFSKSHLLDYVSAERKQSELCKILNSERCGNRVLREYASVIGKVIPDVDKMIGFNQNNPHHIYDVWEHTLHCMDYVEEEEGCDLIVRLAILLHDIGKPACYTEDSEGVGHFYGHARVSKEISEKVLRNLRFSNDIRNKVLELVEAHDRVLEPKKTVVRRLLNKYGEDQVRRLLLLRKCDIFGQDRGSVEYRDNRSKVGAIYPVLEDVLSDEECFKLRDLAIDGRDIICLGVPEGKKVGRLLRILFENVLDGSIENNREVLLAEVNKLI